MDARLVKPPSEMVIHPQANLCPSHAWILKNLLANNTVIDQEINYYSSVSHLELTPIRFSATLLFYRWQQKPAYLIIDTNCKPIGSGSYGQIWRCQQVLINKSTDQLAKFVVKTLPEPMVVKKTCYQDWEVSLNELTYSPASFTYSCPQYNKDQRKLIIPKEEAEAPVYLIRKYFAGDKLSLLIKHLDKRILKISCNKLLELILALLHAYQNQIAARNLIHGDIKPGNIIAKLSADDAWQITIIDYALSVELQTFLNKPYYIMSLLYAEPDKKYTPTTDIYALGMIILEILGDTHRLNSDFVTLSQEEYKHSKKPKKYPFSSDLFQTLPKLTNKHQSQLKKWLTKMIYPNASKR